MLTRTSLLLTLCCLSSLVAEQSSLAQEVSAVTISLVSATSVSDRFQRETEAATRSVPLQVWKTLDDAGWRVQLAEFVVDAAPTLRGVRPAGWPRHLTWDNSDAIHLPSAKLLVVAEKRRDRNGEVVASSRVAGVLRHELGHAFDMAAGGRSGRNLSSSPEFMEAYRNDTARILQAQRDNLAYYLQAGRSGSQETFAEAFAVALGGGSSDMESAAFEASFPRVLAYARKSIADPVPARIAVAPMPPAARTTFRRGLLRRR